MRGELSLSRSVRVEFELIWHCALPIGTYFQLITLRFPGAKNDMSSPYTVRWGILGKTSSFMKQNWDGISANAFDSHWHDCRS